MTDRQETFGIVTVQLLEIGFRFTKRGQPGSGPAKSWLVTGLEGLEEMELRARALRRPEAVDMKAAIAWAVALVRAGDAPGVS